MNGFKNPIGFFPLLTLASFNNDTRPANNGVDALVPPTGSLRPPDTTMKPSPNADTSGVARPLAVKAHVGGNLSANFKYPVTWASCQVAFVRSKSFEKPPPEPN